MISNTLLKAAITTGAAALAATAGNAVLHAAKIAAVRHVGGKMIATKAGLYVAGMLGAPAAVIAAGPLIATGLTVVSTALFVAHALATSRGS